MFSFNGKKDKDAQSTATAMENELIFSAEKRRVHTVLALEDTLKKMALETANSKISKRKMPLGEGANDWKL
jgi:hypothetical protein